MDTQINYYLEDLKRLDEVTVTELETLAIKFPFDQSIRLLLAEKLSFDNNSKLNANLYSSSLFNIHPNELSELATNFINLNTPDFIEMSTNTIPEKQLEIDQLVELETAVKSEESFLDDLEASSVIENDLKFLGHQETNEDLDNQELDLLEKEDASFSKTDEEKQEISSYMTEVVEENPINSKKNREILTDTNFDTMTQQMGYTEWLLLLKPISDVKIIKLKKKKKKDKIKETAKKSIIKSDSIVSEPLANILALQGHYLEAKIMYQKLIDINPDKKDLFKSKIIEIDQLIDQSS